MREELLKERPQRCPTHPGEIIKEDVLPTLKLSVTQAAKEMHITRQTLHRIISKSHGVSPEMALRLGRFCGNGPYLWLAMQQRYDLFQAEERIGDDIEKIPEHSMASRAH